MASPLASAGVVTHSTTRATSPGRFSWQCSSCNSPLTTERRPAASGTSSGPSFRAPSSGYRIPWRCTGFPESAGLVPNAPVALPGHERGAG